MMLNFFLGLILALAIIVGQIIGTPAASPSSTGDAERGAALFAAGKNDAPPCSTCHQTEIGQAGFNLAPNLAGIGERAGTRIEGLTAEQYILQSIVDPRSFVVPDYRDIMYSEYGTRYTDQDRQDLIAYLLTLEA